MKRLALVAALSLTALASPVTAQDHWTPHAPAVAAIDAAIRAPLEAYLRGHATGDRAAFAEAFHADAQLWGTRNGTLSRMSGQDYVNRASGRPPADEAQRRRWIESVDVAGDTAYAKIILDYPATRFTDWMTLMKVEGRWVIINKTFLAEPKT